MLSIQDTPGHFSRVLGEQFPDSTYATAVEGWHRQSHKWFDRLCWLGGTMLLVWLVRAIFRAPW